MILTKPLLVLVALLNGGSGAPDPGRLELVETFPVGTELDQPDLPETHDVWLAMIAGARESIDLTHFYASDRDGSRLAPIVDALEAAADRGVRVRFVADAGFHETYPETLDRLDSREGIDVRLYGLRARTGGVQHAKSMIVDGADLYVGSANFDWRSLEHIQELGFRARSRALAAAYRDVFELDWHLAGGGALEDAPGPTSAADAFPLELAFGDAAIRVTPALSPTGLLPDEDLWDLPRLLAWIESAEERVWVQLLTYKSVGRDGTYFRELEGALRSAAGRGVDVRLLVADWGKRRGTAEVLQSLQVMPNIRVRMVTIPPMEEHIPYARVIHAKYAVVDAERAWIGTSNWERGYFHASRNLGLLAEGAALNERLAAFFGTGWDGPYAEEVDPGARYEAPRIGE